MVIAKIYLPFSFIYIDFRCARASVMSFLYTYEWVDITFLPLITIKKSDKSKHNIPWFSIHILYSCRNFFNSRYGLLPARKDNIEDVRFFFDTEFWIHFYYDISSCTCMCF